MSRPCSAAVVNRRRHRPAPTLLACALAAAVVAAVLCAGAAASASVGFPRRAQQADAQGSGGLFLGLSHELLPDQLDGRWRGELQRPGRSRPERHVDRPPERHHLDEHDLSGLCWQDLLLPRPCAGRDRRAGTVVCRGGHHHTSRRLLAVVSLVERLES